MNIIEPSGLVNVHARGAFWYSYIRQRTCNLYSLQIRIPIHSGYSAQASVK